MSSSETTAMPAYQCRAHTCPQCEQSASSGTHRWDDQGPFQMISRMVLTCPGGHTWRHDSDGS
jgi:hypothetical protein